MATEQIDPLILTPMFILDFLCIYPFHDGNGRMSRLLTLLLLYRAGYIVGKYISMEHLIENTKTTYYECLQASSENWHENQNDYEPFVKYMLGIVIGAYRDFGIKSPALDDERHVKTRTDPPADSAKARNHNKSGNSGTMSGYQQCDCAADTG